MKEKEVEEAIRELLEGRGWEAKYVEIWPHPSDNTVTVKVYQIKEK